MVLGGGGACEGSCGACMEGGGSRPNAVQELLVGTRPLHYQLGTEIASLLPHQD